MKWTFITFLVSFSVFSSDFKDYEKSDYCVSYKTEKGMFLFANVNVVGKNCDLITKVVNIKGVDTLELTIPVESFDSDNGRRDAEVANILGGEEHFPLKLRTTTSKINLIKNGDSKTIEAELIIRNKKHVVEFNVVNISKNYADLELVTKFSTLGIEVSSVAGGFIASPKDELELYGRIQFDPLGEK